MKPTLALLLLLPAALAGCDDAEKPAAALPPFEGVTFRPLEGVEAERLKFDIDKDTGGYVIGLSRQAGAHVAVEVADVHLSPRGGEKLVVLRGATPCKPEVCKLAILKRGDEAVNTVTNIMGFVPEAQTVLLSNVGGESFRDILITEGAKAVRYRYGVVLVDPDMPPTGNYEPVGDEPNPLAGGAPQ